jgi:peptidoglycan/LPS O-acetylase OafA/YrhL
MRQTLHSRFRYAELDGLRGIALLMVLENHLGYLSIPLAWSGLSQILPILGPLLALGWSWFDMYLVLSGFLLGGILLDNKEASNYFKVFYIRRTCRIFPLYFLVLILIALLLSLDLPRFGESLPAWTYLTYTQNIAMAQQGNFGIPWLGPTWSLAVEEQFYLILPFLIWFVSRERLPYLLAGLILAGILYRQAILAFHPHGDFAFWVLLPTRAEPLLLGILGAWAVRNERCLNFLRTRRKLLYGILAVLIASCALLVLVGPYGSTYGNPMPTLAMFFPATYGFVLFGLLFTCLLLIAVTERRGLVSFVTRNRVLAQLGVISYGAFLFHVPLYILLFWLVFGKAPAQVPLTASYYVVVLGSLLLTLALAWISWTFFEKRIVNWGRSFRYKNPIGENVIDEKVVERHP